MLKCSFWSNLGTSVSKVDHEKRQRHDSQGKYQSHKLFPTRGSVRCATSPLMRVLFDICHTVAPHVQKDIRSFGSNIFHNVNPTLLVCRWVMPGHERVAPHHLDTMSR